MYRHKLHACNYTVIKMYENRIKLVQKYNLIELNYLKFCYMYCKQKC